MRAADRNKFLLSAIFTILLLAVSSAAQSTNQDHPSPVTTNEISGTIKPRDVGDSRLTSYFYQFDGSQGDLFINIVTKNFTGDIDVFTQTGLRPLTKIVVYADFGENETGRVIYLRKPEKMILRVQGRTPGDDVATFRIKFAGSFVASTMAEPTAEPALPSLTAKNESGIRVNSVGTIVEVIPKGTPTPPVAEIAKDSSEERREVSDAEKDKPAEVKTEKSDAPAEAPEKKVEVVVTDNIPAAVPTIANRGVTRRNRRTARPPAKPPATQPAEEAKTETTTAKTETAKTEPPKTPPARRRGRPPASTEPKAPDPLANINLVIVFKDGTVIQRPMSEVLRFTVDKGILTVIAKDGSIGRYSIVDVAKVTIE
jgi:hypothetical protein